MSTGPAVNVIGDFAASTGLAEAARRQVLAMVDAGIDVSRVPMTTTAPRHTNRSVPALEALPSGRPARIDVHYENANEFSGVPVALVRPPSREQYAVASWYWELPELNWEFLPGLQRVDEVWVAAEYVQAVFARTSDTPVTVIPPVVEGVTVAPFGRDHFAMPAGRCVFLFSFDASSSYERKNPLGLIEAFRRAFEPLQRRHEVLLVLKTLRLDVFPALAHAVRTAVAETEGVRLITDDLTNEEMSSLLSVADVYVSLHRSEGFGLGMAEAMRHGRPVVATAYSANVDFCHADNSCQVGWTLRQIGSDDHRWHLDMTGLYRAGQWWADPDLDQAAGWMRYLHAFPAERTRIGAAGRATVLRDYSRAAAGAAMLRRLAQIDADLDGRLAVRR